MTYFKRAAIRGYFFERCSGGPQSNDFWPTIKPFLSKGFANSLNICLLEDGKVVNDPVSVCNILNDHFSKIANDIGRYLSEEEVQNHTSVINIREHVLTSVHSVSVPFVFKPISERQVDKYKTSIGRKKATDLDDLSAKVLKIIKKTYVCHLTRMINRMFEDNKPYVCHLNG